MIADKTSSMHDAWTVIWGTGGQMHQCTIVPKHNIKWLPLVAVNIFGLGGMFEQKIKQFLAIRFR